MKPNDKPLCADPVYHPDQWHPDASEYSNSRDSQAEKEQILQAVEALEVCAICPLQKACLDYAFKASDTINYGIFGGTLATERRQAVGYSVPHTMGYILLKKIRNLATSRGVPVQTIGKREKAPSWLENLPDLTNEYINRGRDNAQAERLQQE